MEKTPENKPASSIEKTSEYNPISSGNHSLAHVASTSLNQAPPENLEGNIFQNSHEDLDDDSYFASIPDGWKFLPRDDQLICEYLIPKLYNAKLERNLFHEVDFIEYTPMQLTETYKSQGENQWFFFTKRDRRYPNGTRPRRTTDEGLWKATGVVQHVTRNGIRVGSKTTLVYRLFMDNDSEAKKKDSERATVKTPWMMHEYVVTDTSRPPNGKDSKLDDCVLCKIYKNSRGKNNAAEDQDDQDQYQNQVQFQQVGNEEIASKEEDPSKFVKSSLVATQNPNIQDDSQFFKDVSQDSFITSSFSMFNTVRTCHVNESMTLRQTSNVPSGPVTEPSTSSRNHIPNSSLNSHPNYNPDDIRPNSITYPTLNYVGTSYEFDRVGLENPNNGYPASAMNPCPSSINQNYHILNSSPNGYQNLILHDIRPNTTAYSTQDIVGTSHERENIGSQHHNNVQQPAPAADSSTSTYGSFPYILDDNIGKGSNVHYTTTGPLIEQTPPLTITEKEPRDMGFEELGLSVEDYNLLDSLIFDDCSIAWPEPLPEVGGT